MTPTAAGRNRRARIAWPRRRGAKASSDVRGTREDQTPCCAERGAHLVLYWAWDARYKDAQADASHHGRSGRRGVAATATTPSSRANRTKARPSSAMCVSVVFTGESAREYAVSASSACVGANVKAYNVTAPMCTCRLSISSSRTRCAMSPMRVATRDGIAAPSTRRRPI